MKPPVIEVRQPLTRKRLLLSAVALVMLVFAAPVAAQDQELPDPTRPSPELQRAMEDENPPPLPVGRPTTAVMIPDLKIRGRIVLNSVTVAAVELEGNHYHVTAGEEWVIRSPAGDPLTFTVTELGPRTMRIKVPSVPEEISLP
ncbi:MAG: hypothetical protein EA381_09310 [Planctomycetaceae bacterium]|nr:MAG: hypothetical protein EA381_09310 [Planctomycetaceae bacterium]